MEVLYQGPLASLRRWRVRKGQMVSAASVLCTLLSPGEGGVDRRFISEHSGRILELAKEEGDSVRNGEVLLRFEICKHDIVIKDLCAECGVNLRTCDGMPGDRKEVANASVAMVHNIPELYVSEEKANELADEDTQRLLANRKLVLLIDLDQTLIHTTCEDVPPNLKGVHHFQLPCPGGGSPFYHTKLRPGTEAFLQAMSELFELHIVTFGNRLYAHTIARLLDPEHKYFSHRILSRDEAFNPLTKTANLRSLFPRGDSMVCIIDDRAEVWSFSNHLIHVSPYKYFRGTDDINLPGENTTRVRPAKRLREAAQDEAEVAGEAVSDETEVIGETAKVESVEEEAEAEAAVREDEEKPKTSSSDSGEAEVGSSSAGPSAKTVSIPGEAEVVTSAAEVEAAPKTNAEGVGEAELADSTVPDDDKSPAAPTEGQVDASATTAAPADTVDSTTEDDLWQDRDDYLTHLQQILRRVHAAFYAAYDAALAKNGSEATQLPDLKSIIPELRRSTLRHVRLVFSGIVPLGFAINQSGAFHLARHLGGEVQAELTTSGHSKQRTHYVVASRAGTKKVTLARAHHIRVVSPHWLWQCYFRWQRLSGRDFKLRKDYDPETFDFNDRKRPLPPWTGDPTPLEGSNGKRRKVGAVDGGGMASTSTAALEIARNPLMQMSPEEAFNMRGEVDEEMRSLGEEDSEEEDGRRRKSRAAPEEGELSSGTSSSSSSSSASSRKRPAPPKAKRKCLDDSSAESSDNGSLSGDYPKGWRPRRGDSRSVSSEEEDREYRSCPEGYDYADAEYTWRVLRDESSSSEDEAASGAELTDEDECMDALRAFI